MGITEACLHFLIRNRMAGANISERHPLTGFHHQSPRSCFCPCGELHGRQHPSCPNSPRNVQLANEICATCASDLLIEPLHEVASLIWALVLFDDFTHINQIMATQTW